MVFNSIFFCLTLLPLFLIHSLFRLQRTTAGHVILLLYSYFFYAMWNPAFLLLIWFSTFVDFFAARAIKQRPKHRKFAVVISLCVNLGLLAFFKYWNFFSQSAEWMFNQVGIGFDLPFLDVLLPVGISFYTFQTLSYTIDVYRGKMDPKYSFLEVALFVAFFPQLVAGPIVRAADFLKQMREEPEPNPRRLEDAFLLILCGLFLKCVLADNIGPWSNNLFASWETNTIIQNWCAAGLFGVQIYGDFNGYSMTAIGIALLFGFHIPRNFNAPYGARGFSDFWGRWHISLSSWLRDYLYISLGGNRKGEVRTYANLMMTMLLGGLWHGASVMFIIWGFMHGLFLCLERPFRKRTISPAFSALVIFVTFLAVTATWIPFRAENPAQGFAMLKGLFIGGTGVTTRDLAYLAVIGFIFLAHCGTRKVNAVTLVKERTWARILVGAALLVGLYFFSGEGSQFIYFQF